MLCRRRLRASAQAGSGLIEVAVALLVLAVATLGLGSLQLSARRVGYEAMQRGEAAALAMDLLERLRANRVALPTYSVEGIGEGSGSESAVPPSDCSVGSCSPAELNAWDLWQWQQALDGVATAGGAGGLVRPTACVTLAGRRVTVEIAWQGYRTLAAASQEPGCGTGNYGVDDADRRWLRMNSWIGAE